MFKTLNTTNNSWVPFAGVSDYREAISYDANGNILTYNRKGAPTAGGQLEMDNLYYQYEEDAAGNLASNKLRYVYDGANATNYSEDIDNQTAFGSVNSFNADKKKLLQGTDNYAYDAIGNLVKDTKEGITNIEWTVYGKIKKITKGTTTITYTYDASGNRVSKKVGNVETWYVRDASGNVMAVYSKNAAVNNGYLTQDEVHLYGSSRLGIRKTGRVLDGSLNNGIGKDVVGQEYYELTNHLGNVLVTISDKRVGVDADNNGQVDYYTAVIMSAQDYYAFGMVKPGRKYNVGGYRYGFNGKEKAGEITSDDYDFGARIYDGRVGRWLSLDPIVKSNESPYMAFACNPIWILDPAGGDTIKVSWKQEIRAQPNGNMKSTFTRNATVIEAPGADVILISTEIVNYNAQGNVKFRIKGETDFNVNGRNCVITNSQQTENNWNRLGELLNKYAPEVVGFLKEKRPEAFKTIKLAQTVEGVSKIAAKYADLGVALLTILIPGPKAAVPKAEEYATIYRTISEAEAKSIYSNGGRLTLPPNGNEMKQFFTNRQAYETYIKNTDWANGYLLEMKVPKSMIGNGKTLNTNPQVDEFLFPSKTINTATVNGQKSLDLLNKSVKDIKITKE